MSRIETITSAANPLVKELRRAIGRASLTEDGLWIAESVHLLEEALRSGCEVPAVLAAESAVSRLNGPLARNFAGSPARTLVLPDALFQTITSTETSQGVIALVRPPRWTLDQVFAMKSLVVVLDGIQDPGNAGAIVRAAEAFGATGAIFVKGTVGPQHPKTLRAAAGSLFRLPFVSGLDAPSVAAVFRQERVVVYAAMPYTGAEYLAEDTDLRRRCALVVGGEGHGVGKELRDRAEIVAIPTVGVESLNAAVAAAVLLYEARRQRRAP